jgi:hypothetical protein
MGMGAPFLYQHSVYARSFSVEFYVAAVNAISE